MFMTPWGMQILARSHPLATHHVTTRLLLSFCFTSFPHSPELHFTSFKDLRKIMSFIYLLTKFTQSLTCKNNYSKLSKVTAIDMYKVSSS